MSTHSANEEQIKELKAELDRCRAENEQLRQQTRPVESDSGAKTVVGRLHALLEQQTFITDILQQLQETNDLSETINDIVARLGKYCGASSVTVFENSPDGNFVSNTFEWCNDGVPLTMDRFQNIPYENFPIARRLFDRDKTICANSFEELPAEIRAIFPYYDQAAILFVGMEHGGNEMGFLNINRYTGVAWNEFEVTFVKKVTGVLATAVLRNSIEKELHESETKYRTIIRQLSDLIVIVDDKGIIRYISPAGIRMLGYTSEEMLGTNIFGYVYPDDVGHALTEMGKTLVEDIPEDILPDLVTFRILDSRGEVVTVEGVGRNAFDNEAVKGIILTFRDVSRQKAAEQKIRESLERQQLMTEILRELNYTDYLTDPLQKILSRIAEFSDVCSIMLQYRVSDKADDTLSLTWKSSVLSDEYEKTFAMPSDTFFKWAEHIKNDLILVYDYTHLHDFIKPYYTENTAKRVFAFPFSQHGEVCGMMVLNRCSLNQSIVDWGYNEVSFMQSVAQIISNALERETARKNLMEAKERAEEADKLKSAFLANMSHEIRTPMNGIVGFAALIQKEAISPKVARYAQIVNDNCQMLLQLLDDIIDISKLESKQLRMLPVKCNINRLLSDQLLLYRQLLKKKDKEKIEIILDETTSDETIFVDPVRLQQILMNLVSNAIKFTDKGYIRFGYVKSDNRQLLFHVKDTGIGIPEKQQHFVFDRFRQVEEHSDRNIGGTGIGLAISKSLAEMMGGTIWVESEPGVGSCFYFTIEAKKIPNVTDEENFN